jgi:hypothetical protein
MARTKYSAQFCGYCNKDTKMEMVGDRQEAKEKMWFRCTRCHHMSLIDIKIQADAECAKLCAETATRYTPQQSFKIGESIFHSEWNDVGKVLSKIKTSDGTHAIIVSFEKQGERRLIENLKPEPSILLENAH